MPFQRGGFKRTDRGRSYDHDKYRRLVRARGITPVIARRKANTALGSARCAGSSSAPPPGFTTSSGCSSAYDRGHEIHEAFLVIGCCLVCYRRLENSF